MRLRRRIGLFLLSISRNILRARMAFLLFLIWSRTLGPFSSQLTFIHRYVFGFVWLFDFYSLYFNFQHSIWSSRIETTAIVFDRFIFRHYLLNRLDVVRPINLFLKLGSSFFLRSCFSSKTFCRLRIKAFLLCR